MKWTSCEALEGCGVSVSVPCVGVGLRAIYCVDLTRVADTIDLSEDSHCDNYYLTPIPLDSPLLAATDLGVPKPGNWVRFLFQNAAVPYALPNIRVNTRQVEKAFFRSAHLRSPGRIETLLPTNRSWTNSLPRPRQTRLNFV